MSLTCSSNVRQNHVPLAKFKFNMFPQDQVNKIAKTHYANYILPNMRHYIADRS